MRVPVFPTIGNELHALTRKLVAEIFISSVATLCAMIIFSSFNRPAPAPDPKQTQLSPVDARFAKGETSEAIDDFVEQIALSHVAALKAPTTANDQPGGTAASLPASSPAAPSPRQPTAAKHDRQRSDKARVAAATLKQAPAEQASLQLIEAASEPTHSDIDWLAPLHYGKLLVAKAGDIVAASDARVMEGIASVGDVLTSFNKKLPW
jgi:hypothetical protein